MPATATAVDTATVDLLTIPECAAVLRVHRATVYRLIASGELPVITVRGARRVSKDDLSALIEQNRRTRADGPT